MRIPIVLTVAVLVAATCGPAVGQSYVYYPDDNTGGNMAVPGGWYPWFTNTTGTRHQILIPASAFAGQPAGTGLASLGIFVGTSSAGTTATYSVLQVRMGPAAVSTLTNTFDTNLTPGTETLVLDAPNTVISAQPNPGAWVDLLFQSVFPWPGTDVILDVQTRIPAGSGYLRTAVSSATPRCYSSSYTGQATGTFTSSNGTKVRFQVASMSAAYQVNQVGASADVNAVLGNSVVPATVTVMAGQTAVLTISSIATGQPWDLGYGLAPLVTAAGGGITYSDGQILNLDVADPTLAFLFDFFNGPGFSNALIGLSIPTPTALSLQLAVFNPASPIGLSLSQPNRLIVQ